MGRRILTSWAYSSHFRRVCFGGNDAIIRAEQPMVWLVLTPPGVRVISPDKQPCFPAIMDTGYAGRLLLNVRHIPAWSGLQTSQLVRSSVSETVFGQTLSRYEVTAWLLPSDPTVDPESAYAHPFVMKIEHGATVMARSAAPPWNQRPEIPLIGLSAMAENHLVLTIDARARQIDLETNRKW